MASRPFDLSDVDIPRDLPSISLDSTAEVSLPTATGVTRFSSQTPLPGPLEALFVNKRSDTLVVAFHGATQRNKHVLPRFEWFRTLRSTPYSSLYFSDPTLSMSGKLSIGWYTGSHQYDAGTDIAKWIIAAKKASGASEVVLVGSSAGGFAALQLSPLVEGSIALPFNPQTAISSYLGGGYRLGAQQEYLKYVMPELKPEVSLSSLPDDQDWASPLDSRLSALKTYSKPQSNWVYYAQNTRDYAHYSQHFEPFKRKIAGGNSLERVHFFEYEGPEAHDPPARGLFKRTIEDALAWKKRSEGSLGSS